MIEAYLGEETCADYEHAQHPKGCARADGKIEVLHDVALDVAQQARSLR